jgi:uncharacterized protein YndB with AHSA1/START domain
MTGAMIRSEFTVEIARPPADVFAYLADPSKVPEWQSSAVEAKLATDGAIGVGSRIEEVRSFVGRRVRTTLEVTEYEPERRFSLKTVEGPVPVEVRHTLEPSNGGTRLRFVGTGDPKGFGGFAQSLLVRAAEREFKRDFRRLKAILEDRS